MARRNLVVVLFLCACFLVPLLQSTPAHSANHFSTSTDLSQANATLRSLERALNRRKLDPEKLEEYLSTVDRILSQADKCIADTTSQMENTRAALRLLGPEVKDESRYVARERRSLLRDLDLLERRIADCRLIRFKAGNIKTRIQRAQTELKKHSLLRKHPDILALFRNEKARVHTLPDRFRRVFHRYTGFQGSPRLGPIAVGITGLLVLLAVVPIRRVFVKISSQLKNRTSYLRSIDTVMEITANRLPLLLLLCMFMLVVWITTGRDAKSSWILTASAGLFLFLSTRMAAELIFGILGSPRSPDSSREKAARSCKRRIVLLGGGGEPWDSLYSLPPLVLFSPRTNAIYFSAFLFLL